MANEVNMFVIPAHSNNFLSNIRASDIAGINSGVSRVDDLCLLSPVIPSAQPFVRVNMFINRFRQLARPLRLFEPPMRCDDKIFTFRFWRKVWLAFIPNDAIAVATNKFNRCFFGITESGKTYRKR